MGYWYNLEHEAKEPFEALDEVTTKQILGVISSHTYDVVNSLSEVCDTQTAGVTNCDMMECEIWHYGVEFAMEYADSFKCGCKAFILKYGEVYYIFVCPSMRELLGRITRRVK